MRSSLFLNFFLCCGFLLLSSTAHAGAPKEDDAARAKRLVRELGDEVYGKREQAYKGLLQMGLKAAAAVQAGVDDPSPEISRRCKKLLPIVSRTDEDRDLEAFVAGKEGAKSPTGFAPFARIAGNDAESRLLYMQMWQADRELLGKFDELPKDIDAILLARCQALREKARKRPKGQNVDLQAVVLAIIFVATQAGKNSEETTAKDDAAAKKSPEGKMQERRLFDQLVSLFQQPGLSPAVKNSPPARRLVSHWLNHRTDDRDLSGNVLFLATSMGLSDFIEKRVRPHVLERIKELEKTPLDTNKFYQILSIVQNASQLSDIRNGALKTVVTKHLEEALNGKDFNRIVNAFYLVQSLVLPPDSAKILGPAAEKLVDSVSEKSSLSNILQVAQCVSQFGSKEIVEKLKPIARVRLQQDLDGPLQMNTFYNAQFLVNALGLTDILEGKLRPAAKAKITTLAKSNDLNKLSEAVNIAEQLALAETVERELRPAIRQAVHDHIEKMAADGDLMRMNSAVTLCQRAGLEKVIEETLKPQARKTILQALEKPAANQKWQGAFEMARQLQMKETSEVALRQALDKKSMAHLRGEALNYFLQGGDKALLPKLTPLLEDKTEIGSASGNFVQVRTQIRDVALAVMVHLSGQNPEDYGFPYLQIFQNQPINQVTYHWFGFSNEKERSQALELWHKRSKEK